jgi:hypothetical protein
MKIRNTVIISLIALVVCVVFSAATVVAADTPSGKVRIKSKSIAIGVGVTWGEGVLTFQGKDYKFKLSGLSVVDLGVSSLSVTGEVYNLTKLEDFNGTYVAASAGVAVAGGVSATAMKNQNGVIMKLTSTQKGLKFTLAPEGTKVTLK